VSSDKNMRLFGKDAKPTDRKHEEKKSMSSHKAWASHDTSLSDACEPKNLGVSKAPCKARLAAVQKHCKGDECKCAEMVEQACEDHGGRQIDACHAAARHGKSYKLVKFDAEKIDSNKMDKRMVAHWFKNKCDQH